MGQVMIMLGRQTLAELRDKIPCLSDTSVTTDCSNNPDEYNPLSNKVILSKQLSNYLDK